MTQAFTAHTLRQYALLADGERGALVGPRGDVAFMCAPRWHDDAVFAALLGGGGRYAVTPRDPRFVWGGHYEQGSLIWRSRWVTTDTVIECREALAWPGDPDRVVLLRRVEACDGDAEVDVVLELAAGFGAHRMTSKRTTEGVWEGRTGDLRYRWSGTPSYARPDGGTIGFALTVPQGEHYDLVLEISRVPLPDLPPVAEDAWRRTCEGWHGEMPAFDGSAAPGDSRHSYAVLRGLTSRTGAMVAAATTSLPERAEAGRNYDYRYAWIRDQCYAGLAAAVAGGVDLLDSAVRFVTDRIMADGAEIKPAYTVTGGPVPSERQLSLPGYPGAPVRTGNRVNEQFQLDVLGEALQLYAAADAAGRLDATGWRAVEETVTAIEKRGGDPDAGIWELEDRRWAHSRLACVAGLRAIADRRTGATARSWQHLADRLLRSVEADCVHISGRWQRAPDDERVDASLLLGGLRGAVPADDPHHVRTWEAVRATLADDGYVYRFRQDPSRPLHVEEGAFVLCGFHMALATLQQGRLTDAVRWFERNRSALGPPGLFAEEFDVVQRQLRGNLPQAFVHALLLETAQRLGDAGIGTAGFGAAAR
ncbi:glycoside hydrolase family 15 protein [Nocardioides panacihumi]|uniref:Glycoside hydrolase family 15 protein n=1 Tax=Nocardioides panacihumi TaxID=400774 RepID=A0ABN2QJP4_9ACTN